MAKSVVRITIACALTLFASCQLNDHDSAPRAPDEAYDDDLEQNASPAVADPRGAPNAPNTMDASASNNVPVQTSATSGDAAQDAGSAPPSFPAIPLLEAGSLSPGNFGTIGDAGAGTASSQPAF
jgi:hypothetical protein